MTSDREHTAVACHIRSALLLLFLLPSLAACYAGSELALSENESSTNPPGGKGVSPDENGGLFGDPEDRPAGAACDEDNTDVFVISKQYDLYRFSPLSLATSLVGPIDCPQDGGYATPFSMSIARDGTAWVLFNDGALYKVSTIDASCEATTFVANQSGFRKFGMGFVADDPDADSERLFIANEFGLGELNTSNLTVAPAGSFGFSAAVELTGTGDANLYGLFLGFPPYISQLNKQNSALGQEFSLHGVQIGTSFAFAFWGGSFWVFTAPDGVKSKVDRYYPDLDFSETVVPSLPFKVVGAGVSTCAPTEAPK